METSGWFGVRCVFRSECDGAGLYEERVTIWRADGPDHAIALAETEAAEYAEAVDATYLALAQVYTMADDLADGAEVFSLMRTSSLKPEAYLDTFFDTGAERQTWHDSGIGE
ncbi:hypothetical protein [Jatrophihabitans fulvus]